MGLAAWFSPPQGQCCQQQLQQQLEPKVGSCRYPIVPTLSIFNTSPSPNELDQPVMSAAPLVKCTDRCACMIACDRDSSVVFAGRQADRFSPNVSRLPCFVAVLHSLSMASLGIGHNQHSVSINYAPCHCAATAYPAFPFVPCHWIYQFTCVHPFGLRP